MRSEYFLLLPNLNSIITPNDLYIYNNLNKNTYFEKPFTPLTLSCYYIKGIDGIQINSLRHLGKIINNIDKKQEWIRRLKNLKNAVIEYFKLNYNITDSDKIFIYTIYPESKLKSLRFNAIYSGDFLSRVDMIYYEYNLYYIDDIINNINLSIINNQEGKEVNIIYDIDYYYYKNNLEIQTKKISKNNSTSVLDKQWKNGTLPKQNIGDKKIFSLSERTIPLIDDKWKKDKLPIKSYFIGGSIPLEINLNTYENRIHKKKLKYIVWYFIENKIDKDTGFDNGYIYGYKTSNSITNYYKLKIKANLQDDVYYIKNYYNLFSHYYVGYFEYELYLSEEKNKKIFSEYTLIIYDTVYKTKIDLYYYLKYYCKDGEHSISELLFMGNIPNSLKKDDIKTLVSNNIDDHPNFNKEKSLNLLKLTLIMDKVSLENKELIYTTDNRLSKTVNHKFKDDKMNDDNILYISNMIFMLDYISFYKFKLSPTKDIDFTTILHYETYFSQLFNKVLDKNNVIEYVGWFLYDDKFTFKKNITDVDDTEYNINYLKNIHNTIIECFHNYFNKLNIFIPKENIILYYHNPSWIYGLHIRILIIKDFYKYLFGQEIIFNIKNRYFYSDNIINLLNLKINYLKNNTFVCYTKNPIDDFYEKNKDNNCSDLLLGGNNLYGGVNQNYKLKKWILYYIDNKNINNFYIVKKIILDFTIEEKYISLDIIKKNKSIQKWYSYKYIMRDTIGIMFRNLLINLFNILISEYIYDRLLLLVNNENNLYDKKLFIGKMWKIDTNSKYFNIQDNNKISDFDINFDNMFFNIIIISPTIDVFDKVNISCQYLKKIIISLIWSLNHIYDNGIIILVLRDTVSYIGKDLLLLLSQFSDISININNMFSDPSGYPIRIIIKNIKNKDILLKHLLKISTFECTLELSFMKINNVVSGSLLDYEKTINNITTFMIDKINNYMDSYKISNNKTNYPNISKENEELYLIKSVILFLIQYLFLETFNEEDYYSLFEIIKKTNTKKILQIGLNNGHWTIFMSTFLKYVYHDTNEVYKLISIDPFQDSIYKNIGIDNIKGLNLLDSIILVEEFSYIYMEKKIKKKKNYDIIFINEYNTYDYSSIDIYNSFKLLNINGYLIIEGIINPKMNKILISIEKNYKNLKKINMSLKNIAIYNKIK